MGKDGFEVFEEQGKWLFGVFAEFYFKEIFPLKKFLFW